MAIEAFASSGFDRRQQHRSLGPEPLKRLLPVGEDLRLHQRQELLDGDQIPVGMQQPGRGEGRVQIEVEEPADGRPPGFLRLVD
jgi:hypothetical protein